MKNGVPDMLFAWKQGVSSYGTLELAIRMSVTRPRKYRTTILGQSFGVQGRLELNLSS